MRAGAGVFVVSASGAAIRYAALILLARLMGAKDFGTYVFVLGWVNILGQLGRLGFDTASVRQIPQLMAKQSWGPLQGFLRRSIQISTLTSFVAGLGIVAVSSWLVDDADLRLSFLIGGGVLVALSMLLVMCSRLRALKLVIIAVLPYETFRPLLISVGVVGVYVMQSHEDVSSPTAMLINFVVTLALMVMVWRVTVSKIKQHAKPAEPSFDTWNWIQIAISMVWIQAMMRLLSRVDLIMLGSIEGTDVAGIYAAASETALLVSFALSALTTIGAPMIAEQYALGQRDQMRRIGKLVALAATVCTAPAFILLWFIGDDILSWFNPEYAAGSTALLILAGGQMVNALTGVTTPMLTMTRHEKIAGLGVGAGLVLNVILNAILIPMYGLEGAAISTAVSLSLQQIGLVVIVIRVLRVNPTLLPLPKTLTTERGHDEAS